MAGMGFKLIEKSRRETRWNVRVHEFAMSMSSSALPQRAFNEETVTSAASKHSSAQGPSWLEDVN